MGSSIKADIARLIRDRCSDVLTGVLSAEELAIQILARTDAYYKEKYKDKIYSQEETQGIVDVAIMRARLGYVKLADDQSLPFCNINDLGIKVQQDMLKADWRRVEVKDGS